jgi:hypothetical protein
MDLNENDIAEILTSGGLEHVDDDLLLQLRAGTTFYAAMRCLPDGPHFDKDRSGHRPLVAEDEVEKVLERIAERFHKLFEVIPEEGQEECPICRGGARPNKLNPATPFRRIPSEGMPKPCRRCQGRGWLKKA